jgi:ferritin-like metal-binding protein YciE
MASSSRKSTRSAKESPDGTELLTLELQEIHNAESQLARVLPRLMKAVESEQLQKGIEKRMQQGERLIGEIESALEEMDASPGRKKNAAAEGLINEAREHVQEIERGPALDAVLIATLQKTEHYCIAAWGTARALGSAAGNKDVVKSMERALQEGKQMDEALTKLAEEEVNPQVFAGAESEETEEEDGEEEEAASAPRSRKGGRQENRKSS